MTRLRCPICHRSFDAESSDALPFCSERCQQIDLSRWLGERYGLPVQRTEEDDEEPPPEAADN